MRRMMAWFDPNEATVFNTLLDFAIARGLTIMQRQEKIQRSLERPPVQPVHRVTRQPFEPKSPELARHMQASAAGGETLFARPDQVIELQRRYGNQFVLELLDSAAGTAIQRAATSALDKNSSLAERKELKVLTSVKLPSFSPKELKDAFTGTEKASPQAEEVLFGANIDAKLRHGLQKIAEIISSGEGFTDNTVTNLPLDLTPFGGVNGVYRFSLIRRKTAPKTRLIVEQVSSSPPAQLSKKDIEAQDTRFQKFEFKFGTDFSGDDARKLIFTALARVPDAVLEHVRGLTFSRHLQAAGDRDEPGHYVPNTHTIELYGSALEKLYSSADAGGADWFTFAVMHEIGHAADYESFTTVQRKRDAIAAQLREARLEARRVDPDAGIGKDADTKEKAKQIKIKQLEKELDKAQADFDKAVGDLDLAKGGGRSQSKAFKDAEGNPISRYGATANLENFAEDFSIYVLDPDLLKSLRPEAHKYFSKTFK